MRSSPGEVSRTTKGIPLVDTFMSSFTTSSHRVSSYYHAPIIQLEGFYPRSEVVTHFPLLFLVSRGRARPQSKSHHRLTRLIRQLLLLFILYESGLNRSAGQKQIQAAETPGDMGNTHFNGLPVTFRYAHLRKFNSSECYS